MNTLRSIFSATTFSIMTLSTKGLIMTLSIHDTQLKNTSNNADCSCAECRFLFIVTLNVNMLNVVMLNVIVLSVAVPCFLHTFLYRCLSPGA